MKRKQLLNFELMGLLCTICTGSVSCDFDENKESESTVLETTSEEENNMKELLSDVKFENGFNLLTTKTTNGRAYTGTINYNNEAKDSPSWMMAQWWTPYDFINANYFKVGNGIYDYRNESRHLLVDTNEGSLQMDLNSWTEYEKLYNHSRTGTEEWSHFLIEQDFKEPYVISNAKHIYVHLDFKINKSDNMDKSQAVPCSQITWYFTVTNVTNGNPKYDTGNDFFWFGLPIYDSRYETMSGYKNLDAGFEGATNKLIYTIDNTLFFDKPIKVGEERTIDLDILPYLKQAYIDGTNAGAMPSSNWNNLVLNYMNLGWELPGSYDVSLTIKNISIAVEEKE